MTKEQIADLLGIPYERIEQLCQDTDMLPTILAYAISAGINHGYSLALQHTNEAMKEMAKLAATNTNKQPVVMSQLATEEGK